MSSCTPVYTMKSQCIPKLNILLQPPNQCSIVIAMSLLLSPINPPSWISISFGEKMLLKRIHVSWLQNAFVNHFQTAINCLCPNLNMCWHKGQFLTCSPWPDNEEFESNVVSIKIMLNDFCKSLPPHFPNNILCPWMWQGAKRVICT